MYSNIYSHVHGAQSYKFIVLINPLKKKKKKEQCVVV